MPKKKWIRFLGGAILFCTCFALFIHGFFPPTMINAENAATIQLKMTAVEVFAILGGPPRDEATGPIEYDDTPGVEANRWAALLEDRKLFEGSLCDNEGRLIGVGRLWTSNDIQVDVSFDLDDIVTEVTVHRVHRVQNGIWDSVRNLIERMNQR